MSSLKLSIFWVSLYLAAIFILAQFDYTDSPIIDFAKYFYFMVMVAVPATVFFPYTSKVSVIVPVVVWGSVYFVMLQLLDRTASAPNSSFAIILLEFVLLVLGVWLSYQLAQGIRHAESILDALAVSAFPNRTQNIEEATRQIKIEITRSRRYHRPLCLLAMYAEITVDVSATRLISGIQQDLTKRFSFARVGQVIGEHIRQTDMVFRDQNNRFVILCPETNYQSSQSLARRISFAVREKTGMEISWGSAAFPDDALNFDDLMDVAVTRLARPKMVEEEPGVQVEA
ncbi:MAG: hypothetical protein DPW18_07445 [Chloroflexi bacterium]|nr:MAG: diguanylate cyclase [Chloroflexota bacterium]MCQ3936867.1 hypothetical protein [Chloroflexota bacterium]MDL1941499.1 diguanylate cyclase [Chloroflexi bacterium CFX2]